MNLFERFKKLFNKQNIITNSKDIINLNDLIKIPSRKESDKNIIILIDKYKSQYLRLLATKKYMLSKEISSEHIHNNLDMNIKLLLNICFDEDKPKNKIDINLRILKINIYYQVIKDIEIEVISRVNALKEIYKEKVFLSHNKKQVLLYEINNLTSIYNILLTNRFAIEKERESYLKQYENRDLSISEDEENEIIKTKLNELTDIAQLVIPNFNRKDYKTLADIAFLERQFEIYAYEHKDISSKIRKKLNTKNSNFYYFYEFELHDIELLCRLFYKYSRGLINDDDMLELYRYKFKDKIHNCEGIINSKLLTENIKSIELECYKQVIMEIIENIVTDKYGDLNRHFKNKKNYAINCIIKILKDGEDVFNPEKILNDDLLLNVLCCYSNITHYNFSTLLEYFFKNYMIPRELRIKRIIDSAFQSFTLDNQISLDTLFKLDNVMQRINIKFVGLGPYTILSNKNKIFDRLRYLKLLYLIYNKPKYDYVNVSKKTNQKYFHIPEGISGFYRFDLSNNNDSNELILKELFKDVDSSIVVLPSSLKEINGDIFNGHQIKGIKLNNGLATLKNNALSSQILSNITIPSSVEYIAPTAFNIDELDTITFDNYDESQLLLNEESFKIFLKSIMIINKAFRPKNKNEHDLIREERNILFKVENIVLKHGNFSKIIKLNRIKYFRKIDGTSNDSELNEMISFLIDDRIAEKCDIDYIYSAVKKKIYNQTGFMLGQKNEEKISEKVKK